MTITHNSEDGTKSNRAFFPLFQRAGSQKLQSMDNRKVSCITYFAANHLLRTIKIIKQQLLKTIILNNKILGKFNNILSLICSFYRKTEAQVSVLRIHNQEGVEPVLYNRTIHNSVNAPLHDTLCHCKQIHEFT